MTSTPSSRARIVAAAMTLLRPGAGPPPQRIASLLWCPCGGYCNFACYDCAISARSISQRRPFLHAISLEGNLLPGEDVRLEKETFGPVLRAARERRGVTLKQLAAETKLSVELWEALEDSNLSRWPKRVFARSYVRDYAQRVGLDADEVVNEFCRLFPEWGDRRAEHVIREKAQIIAHDLDVGRPSGAEQPPRQRSRRQRSPWVRRAPSRAHPRRRDRHVRGAGAAAMCGSARRASRIGPRPRSPPCRTRALATFFAGRTFGLVASEWILRTLQVGARHPPPALLAHRKRVIRPAFARRRFFLISSRSLSKRGQGASNADSRAGIRSGDGPRSFGKNHPRRGRHPAEGQAAQPPAPGQEEHASQPGAGARTSTARVSERS